MGHYPIVGILQSTIGQGLEYMIGLGGDRLGKINLVLFGRKIRIHDRCFYARSTPKTPPPKKEHINTSPLEYRGLRTKIPLRPLSFLGRVRITVFWEGTSKKYIAIKNRPTWGGLCYSSGTYSYSFSSSNSLSMRFRHSKNLG